MTAAVLTWNIDDEQPLAALDFLRRQSVDARAFLDNVGAYLDSDATQRFIQGVSPDGTPWLSSQRAINEGGKTLVDTSVLMSSLTHNVISDTQVEHGVTEIYGAIHQYGGTTGRNNATNMPARPFLGVASRQQLRIERMLTDWMKSWFL